MQQLLEIHSEGIIWAASKQMLSDACGFVCVHVRFSIHNLVNTTELHGTPSLAASLHAFKTLKAQKKREAVLKQALKKRK